MKSDYKSAIQFFTSKKKFLEEELKNTNLAIESLVQICGAPSDKLDFSKFKVVTKANSYPVKIPENYSVDLKYPAKIKWLLKNGGPQTIYEMLDFLNMIYDVDDEKKLFNGLTYAASDMFRRGEINAVRVGKANRYSLKEADNNIQSPLRA